ncbi:unnamed protein product [Bemisia tabaci]|uniref:BOD1/SHG1 domain-containing protein n=1 Tax=Bemisia tabaci TaxID=7038 RepID=A0A9P0AEC4_BEMTA|nr:unnamed protein product [Bemisia tabaci]
MESTELCEANATNYLPGDPELIDKIVFQLKLQGLFDEFRKECLADVDTKPAYQNLRQRVDTSVESFLNRTTWCATLNKKNVRENLRKHVYDCRFLDMGLERIVEQVVNPKICSVFMPKVEEVVYKFLGIPIEAKPEAESTSTSNKGTEKGKSSRFKGEPHNLLPEELEPISPDHNGLSDGEVADKSEDKQEDTNLEEETKEIKEEILSPSRIKQEAKEDSKEDDTSPMFEPHHGKKDSDSEMSGISDMLSQSSLESPKKTDSPEMEVAQVQTPQDTEIKVEIEAVSQDFNVEESEPMIDASAISPLTSSSVGSPDSPREKMLFSEKMFDETCASYISIKSANEGQFDDESSDSDGYERVRITYSPKEHFGHKDSNGLADGKKSISDLDTSSIESRIGGKKDNGREGSPGVQLSQEDDEELSLPKTPTIHYDNAEFESVNELQKSIKKTQEKSVEESSLTSSDDCLSKSGVVKDSTENSNMCFKQTEESNLSIDTENSLSGKKNLTEQKKRETQKLYERNSKESERKHSHRSSHSSRKDSATKERHSHSSKSSRDVSKESKEKSSKDGKESSHKSKDYKSSKDSKDAKVQKDKETKPSKDDSSKDKHEHSSKAHHSSKESQESKDSKHHSRDSKHSSKHRSSDRSSKDHHRSSSKDSHDKHKSSKEVDKKSKDEGKEKNSGDKTKEEKKTDKNHKDRKNKDQCSSSTSSRDRDSRRSSDRDNDGSSSTHRNHKSSQIHSTSETSRKEDPPKKSSHKHSSSSSKSSDSSDSTKARIVHSVLEHPLPDVNLQDPPAATDVSSQSLVTKSELQQSLSDNHLGNTLILFDKTPKVILERCSLDGLQSPPMNVSGSHASIISLASSFSRIKEDTDSLRVKKPRNAANFLEAKKMLEQHILEKQMLSEQSKRDKCLENKSLQESVKSSSVASKQITADEPACSEPPSPKKRKIAANIFQSLDKPNEQKILELSEESEEIVSRAECVADFDKTNSGSDGPIGDVSLVNTPAGETSKFNETVQANGSDLINSAMNRVESELEVLTTTENNGSTVETERDQSIQQMWSGENSIKTESYPTNLEENPEKNSDRTNSEANAVELQTNESQSEVQHTQLSKEVNISLKAGEMDKGQNIAQSTGIETKIFTSPDEKDLAQSGSTPENHGFTAKTASSKNADESKGSVNQSENNMQDSLEIKGEETLITTENKTKESNQSVVEGKSDKNSMEEYEQNTDRTEVCTVKENVEVQESSDKSLPQRNENSVKDCAEVMLDLEKDEDLQPSMTRNEGQSKGLSVNYLEAEKTAEISLPNTSQSEILGDTEQSILKEENQPVALSVATREIGKEASAAEILGSESAQAESMDVNFEISDELKADPKTLFTKFRSFLVSRYQNLSTTDTKSLEQIPAQDLINQQFLNFVNNFELQIKPLNQKISLTSDYVDIDSDLDEFLRLNNFQVQRQYCVSVPEIGLPCWVYDEKHDCFVLKEGISPVVSNLKRKGGAASSEEASNQMKAKKIKIYGISTGELQVSPGSPCSGESSTKIPHGAERSRSNQASTKSNISDVLSLSTSQLNDSISPSKYDGDCSFDDSSILTTPNKSLTAQLIEPALESLLAESGLAPFVPGGNVPSPKNASSEEAFSLPPTPESESILIQSKPLKGSKRHSGESNATAKKKSPISGKTTPPMKQRNALVESSQGKLQRYDSSDLYKPRPLFSQTSRRARSNNSSTRDSIGVENESINALNSNIVTKKR